MPYKLTWMSNAPWASSGYGVQTKLFVPRLQQAGYAVSVIATYGLHGGVLNWNGVPIYPGGLQSWSMDIMSAHAHDWGSRLLISLFDAWVFEPQFLLGGLKWAPWYPVDMEPIPLAVMRNVAQADVRLVYSRFGERMTHDAGLDCYYIPHGVDANRCTPGDRQAAREKTKLPQDAFIVGMIATNKGVPSRKALPENIRAFAEFKRKRPDAVLYLHTTTGEHGEFEGVNLSEFVAFCGLTPGKDVLFADHYRYLVGFPDEYMTALYQSFDVLNAVSMGEGFGVPILEAQACGIPVIIGDWTSMSELGFSGWRVDKKDTHPWWTPLAGYQFMPRPQAITAALEQAYRHSGAEVQRTRARQGALAYDADRVVADYWLPVLDTIGDKLGLLDDKSA